MHQHQQARQADSAEHQTGDFYVFAKTEVERENGSQLNFTVNMFTIGSYDS